MLKKSTNDVLIGQNTESKSRRVQTRTRTPGIRWGGLLSLLLLLVLLAGACRLPAPREPQRCPALMPDTKVTQLLEQGSYTSAEAVARYLQTYNRLPSNFITKAEAQQLGWDADKGNLWSVAPGKSIGGDHFGNYERRLPHQSGRRWQECDLNYRGGFRGPERLVYSNDGLFYVTVDHYEHFERLDLPEQEGESDEAAPAKQTRRP